MGKKAKIIPKAEPSDDSASSESEDEILEEEQEDLKVQSRFVWSVRGAYYKRVIILSLDDKRGFS